MSCIRSNLVPGALGFLSAQCTQCPCPLLTLADVRICFLVNNVSQVVIQQGCEVANVAGISFDTPSHPKIAYQSGVTEDSWGRSCRTVVWQRFVQADRYIRIRVCPSSDCATCGDEEYTVSGGIIQNQLQTFTVNGTSVIPGLTLLARQVTAANNPAYAGDDNASSIGCTGACLTSETLCGLGSLTSFPGAVLPGTSIVVGPLNNITVIAGYQPSA